MLAMLSVAAATPALLYGAARALARSRLCAHRRCVWRWAALPAP